MIAGNHKPVIRNVDEAMRRRMNLVPFLVTIAKKARETLVSQWAQFAPESRTTCMEAQAGFSPSYVELLTCLQIAKEVKGLPSPVR